MAIVDPDKLWPKLEEDGVDEVRKKLAMGVYAQNKVPVIEEWLHRKGAEQKVPTYMYHEFDAPEGRVFQSSEVPALEKSGWVDSPAKFGKGFKSKSRRALIKVKGFCISHWQWIIGAVVIHIIIAIYLS